MHVDRNDGSGCRFWIPKLKIQSVQEVIQNLLLIDTNQTILKVVNIWTLIRWS